MSSDGHVHCDIPASDHNHIATDFITHPRFYFDQKLQSKLGQIFSIDADDIGFPCTSVQEHTVILFDYLIQLDVLTDFDIHLEFHAHVGDRLGYFTDFILRQAVFRKGIHQKSARFLHPIDHSYRITFPAEVEGSTESCRASTDNANCLPILVFGCWHKLIFVLKNIVANISLNLGNIYFFIILVSHTFHHTKMGANA